MNTKCNTFVSNSRRAFSLLSLFLLFLISSPLTVQAVDEMGLYEIDENAFDDAATPDTGLLPSFPGGTPQLVNGQVDVDGDGDIDLNDDGTVLTYTIIDGFVDLDNDAKVGAGTEFDEDDLCLNGCFDGFDVLFGYVDFNGDDVAPSKDDGEDVENLLENNSLNVFQFFFGTDDTTTVTQPGGVDVNNSDLTIYQGGATKDPEAITDYELREVIGGLVDISDSGTIGPPDSGIFDIYEVKNGFVDVDKDGTTNEEADDGIYFGYPVVDGYLVIGGCSVVDNPSVVASASEFTACNATDLPYWVGGWEWSTGNVQTKNDIYNAWSGTWLYPGATGSVHQTNDFILYFGADTTPATGSSALSFWFVQDDDVVNSEAEGTTQNNKQFAGVNTDADLLVQTDIASGGSENNAVSRVYVWNPDEIYPGLPANDSGTPNVSLIFSGTTCVDSGGATEQAVCTVANNATELIPDDWPYLNDGIEVDRHTRANFVEGGVNVSAVYRKLDIPVPCFSKAIAETRSTASPTGTLTDFLITGFESCAFEIFKTGDSVAIVGDQVTFTIEIRNTGLLPLTFNNIVDPLIDDQNGPGYTTDAALSAGCGYVEANTSCFFDVYYTTSQGDADPLVNSVSATATSLDGKTFDSSDTHSVDLIYPGSIGDQVWLDEDGNGVFDAGEDGIAGVTVTLSPVLNVSGGRIDFNGDGLYNDNDDGNINGTAIVDGYLDLDGDGVITEFDDSSTYGTFQGQSVIDGVLQGGATSVSGDTQTTVTDANGEYIFTNLPGGDYNVSIGAPGGLDVTYDADQGAAADGGTPPDTSTDVTLAQAEHNTTTDFGLNWVPYTSTDNNTGTGAIGDRVWNDADGDGVQDEGESGISNVVVVLSYDSNGDGVIDKVYDSAVTDATGNYIFDELPAGIYEVSVYGDFVDAASLPELGDPIPTASGPANFTQTADPDGTVDNATSAPILLAPGDVFLLADFGYQDQLAQPKVRDVEGEIYLDANVNGVNNTTSGPDEGLSGVNVALALEYVVVDGRIDLNRSGDGLTDDGFADGIQVIDGQLDLDGDGVIETNGDDDGYFNGVAVINGYLDIDGDGLTGAGETAGHDNGTANAVVASTTTIADGSYTFPDVEPGFYTVLVTDTDGILADSYQTGDIDEGNVCITCDGATSFELTTANVANKDFGYAPTGHEANEGLISGSVGLDTTIANDSIDPGEELPGIDVTIWQQFQVIDDGSGNFLVDLDNDTDVSGGPVTDDSGLLDGIRIIDGFVDFDGDGEIDGADDGTISCSGCVFDGLTVTNGSLAAATTLEIEGDTTTTDASGYYAFGGLDPQGQYRVVLESGTYPPGTVNDFDYDEGLGTTAIDGVAVVNLFDAGNSDDEQVEVDFGLIGNGAYSLSGTVWNDTNADGTLLGEAGVFESVTVELYDNSGNLIATAETDASGNYSFDNLVNGTYTVKVTDENRVLTGYWLSDGTNDGVDNNSQSDPYEVTISGASNNTADFGYYIDPAIVGNTVFKDINGDGFQDAGETGYAGVDVLLTVTYPGAGAGGTDVVVTVITSTDENGNYLFDNLLYDEDFNGEGSGQPNYSVSVDASQAALRGYLSTDFRPNATADNDPAEVGAGNGVDGDADTATGTDAYPVQGTTDATNDFGFSLPSALYGSATGGVWLDTDLDGVWDIGEPGIDNVTVYLCRAGVTPCDSFNAIDEAVTDANGYYSFPDLGVGDYQVQVEPAELNPGNDLQGLDETSGNIAGNANFNLSEGENEIIRSLGYIPVAGTAVIEGTVWSDANTDGVLDPSEVGIGTVTVQLFNPDGSPVLIGGFPVTAETGPDGSYIMTGIPPGDYFVAVITTGDALLDFCDDIGTADCNTTVTTSVPISVEADDIVSGIDFGFDNPPGTYSINDTVWSDLDGNKLLDGDDFGLAGITVDLYSDPDGIPGNGDEVVIATVATDANGEFNFDGVPEGTYELVISDNFGVLDDYFETTSTGGSAAILVNDTTTGGDGVLDTVGDNGTETFGYRLPGTISGAVYSDANESAVFDPSESGLAGIVVELRDDVGNLVAETLTAADGSYSFNYLDPGDYTVVLPSAPPDVQTGDPDATCPGGGCDDETTVTLNAGESIIGLDFGYNNDSLSNVSGTVFNDFNENAVHEPDGGDGNPGTTDDNETGIGGVTIALLPVYDIIDGKIDLNGDGNTATNDNGFISGSIDNVEVILGLLDINGDGVIDTNDDGTFNGIAVVDGWMDVDGDGLIDGDETIGEDSGSLVGDPVATTVTDANGDYLFEDVPEGDYIVAVTDDDNVVDGYTLTSGLDERDITAVDDTDVTDIDFGYVTDSGTGSIGDTIWLDSNGDGYQGSGEPGIAGVTVELFSAGEDGVRGGGDDVSLGTAITDADGNYLFDRLPADEHYVQVLGGVPGGLQSTIIPPGEFDPDSTLINLSEGEEFLDADIGYKPDDGTVVLGDRVWFDTDGDGLQDAGEAGIGGVDVIIYDPSTDTSTIVTTNDSGLWLATGLDADKNYIVYVDDATLPEGVNDTPTNLDGGDTYITPVLSAGDVLTYLDFGFTGNVGSSIGDTVWLDTNEDGIRQENEEGLSNVGIRLISVGADGIANTDDDFRVASTTTDANGEYLFTGLQDGDYFVEIAMHDAPVRFADFDGTPDSTDTGAGTNATNNQTGIINLDGGEFYETADFGFVPNAGTAIIGDRIWSDANGDGVQDNGEAGIADVTVNLSTVAIIDGYVDLNADGSFDANDAGSYGGFDVINATLDINGDGLVLGDALYVAGSDDGTVNGFAVIDGRIDVDGINGVDGDDDQASLLINSIMTDADGSYLFTNVAPGEYVVEVDTGTVSGTNTGDPEGNGDSTTSVSAAADEMYLDADFGYYDPDNASGVIGDFIYLDANGDGDCEIVSMVCTESGIDGVTVNLKTIGIVDGYVDLNGDGQITEADDGSYSGFTVIDGAIDTSGNGTIGPEDIGPVNGITLINGRLDLDNNGSITIEDVLPAELIATTTTAGGGLYEFSGLPSGDYRVEVTDNANLLGGMTETQSAPQDLTIVCSSGCNTIDDADFGYAPNTTVGTIGDEVFIDANNNGVWDDGEGLAGVAVNLYDPGPDGVFGGGDDSLIETTTTNADGIYTFAGLPAGNYYVEIPQAPSDVSGTSGTAGSNASAGHTDVIALGTGEVFSDADFGYVPAGTTAVIGDRIWSDSNGNGIQDDGEPGIGGVTVELQPDGGGTAIQTVTTAPDGSYLFSGVPAGSYEVVVTDSGGVLATYTQTGDPDGGCTPCTSPNETGVTVAAGDAHLTADFGYELPDAADGSIGDTVYADTNGNGVQDGLETGIDGVSLSLFTVGIIDGYVDLDGDGVISPADDGSYGGYDVIDGAVDTSGNGTIGPEDIGTANGFTVIDGRLDVDGINGITGDDDLASQFLTSTTTAAGGTYTFNGLPAGEYRVEVTDTAGVLNGQYATQSDGNVSLASGQAYEAADFGFAAGTASGSIGDFFYFDADGDGVQDPGEAGISGVTMNLIEAGPDGILGNGDDVLIDTTATNASGNYVFDGLAEGKYQVVVTDLNNVVGDLIGTEAADSPILISCGTSCTDVSDADFGYKPTVGEVGNIGGTIWRDTINPGDAELEAGEPGVIGAEVELWLDVNGDGIIEPGVDNLVRTTITDANGDYNFLGLPPGDYIVRVPDDVTEDVTGNTGTNDVLLGMENIVHGSDADADNNGHTNAYPVNLSSGETDTTVDFAYKAVTPYDISGKIYEDADGGGDAFVSGEDASAPDAVVTLYRVVDGVEVLVGSTITDVNGDYEFLDLPPAEYVVKVNTSGTVVDGLDQTVDPDATLDSETTIDLAGCPVDPHTPTCEDQTGIDFAYWNGGVITTPVTLSYFEAVAGDDPGEIYFSWTTSTEAGNVGFDLYVVNSTGVWRRLNEQIIPVENGVPTELRHYAYFARMVEGETFYIVDTDIYGDEIAHGPFALGEVYGVKDRARSAIDHKSIKQEHDAKKEARKQRKQDKMEEKLQKMKEKLKEKGRWSSSVQTSPEPHWAARLAGGVLSLFVGTAQAAELPVTDSGLLRIEVTQPGVHRITFEDLNAAGVNLNGVDADVIAMTNMGDPVPLRVNRDGKGAKKSFGPGWYIDFVGERLDTLYTKVNVYRLYLDEALALRISGDGSKLPRNAQPESFYMETSRVADELLWESVSPTGDPWFMSRMHAFVPYLNTYPIAVDDYAGTVAPVTLKVDMWGYNDWPEADNDHHVIISFNDELTTEVIFDGITGQSVESEITAGLLQEGSNTVTFSLPLDTGEAWDLVNLDSYAVTYPRSFISRDGLGLQFSGAGEMFEVQSLDLDQVLVYRREMDGSVAMLEKAEAVSQPDGSFKARFPGLASAADYFVTTTDGLILPDLLPPAEDGDITTATAQYLVIAHPDFIGPDASGVDSLADLLLERQANGLSVMIADIEQVYSQFGHGIFDPQGIRDYIAYAYANMGTEMVLLVGGDTLDYHGYFDYFVDGNGDPVFDAVSFVPSLYTATGPFVGVAPVDPLYADVDYDNIPDLAIGRFPVRTSADLKLMVDKTLAWQQRDYTFTSLFVADDYDTNNGYDFKADAEDMLTRLPPEWRSQVTPAYMDDLGKNGARSTIIDTLNGGVALTSFVGHSDTSIWTFDGLFSGADALALTNYLRPTIVTQWGCWNTFYVTPRENTLGHEFLIKGEQGAAAVLGASTLTEAAHERELAKYLYDRLFQPGVTLGQAVKEAKQAYAVSAPAHVDVILGWTLLGDPGLVVGAGGSE